ncbi:MAG TPA: hypothetical protein VL500_07965 [Candidatus Eisenbacteria bacterium]|nr:hypothetical protein [Candidatus Eisenbacteria bacterium]
MRFELTIKDADAVPAAVAALAHRGITAVNVTDTSREIDPVAIGRRLLTENPGLDVMVHLSAKHSESASPAASRNAFSRRLADCMDAKIRKVLIVSGHPKGEFDSLAALEVLDAEGFGIDAYCVHNPFLEGTALDEENARITRKLGNGLVRGVCFQIGTDLGAIARASTFLRSMRYDIELLGSVPIPDTAMLERLKTKPLFGVRLPETYLASAQEAARMTSETLMQLDAYDIEPLFFTAELDESTISLALALMGKG